MSTTTQHGSEQLPDADELKAKVGRRIWPAQAIGMCGHMLECFAALQSAHRINAVPATKTELEDIAIDLKRVAECAAQLSREFKQSAEAKR